MIFWFRYKDLRRGFEIRSNFNSKKERVPNYSKKDFFLSEEEGRMPRVEMLR